LAPAVTAPLHHGFSAERLVLRQAFLISRMVFTWVLGMLAEEGLLLGQTVAIDGTTLEANAALRSIVRRDTGTA
jgi:transposase